MRRSFTQVKAEIEKEIGMDEVKRQLHNEAIMEEMKRIEAEVKNTADAAKSNLNQGIQAAAQTQTQADSPDADTASRPSVDPEVEGEISDLIAAQDGGAADSAEPEIAAADDRDHSDAGADADDRDHSDAASTESAVDDRDHTDAGAEPDSRSPAHRATSG